MRRTYLGAHSFLWCPVTINVNNAYVRNYWLSRRHFMIAVHVSWLHRMWKRFVIYFVSLVSDDWTHWSFFEDADVLWTSVHSQSWQSWGLPVTFKSTPGNVIMKNCAESWNTADRLTQVCPLSCTCINGNNTKYNQTWTQYIDCHSRV